MVPQPAGVPESNPDLEWFYRWSPAECGLHSPALEYMGGGGLPDTSGLTESEMAAASRQGKIKRALLELSGQFQSILEACYEPRPQALQLAHEHGIAAGWVARHLKCKDVSAETLHLEVLTAHAAFTIVFGKPARTRAERVGRWLSDEGLNPCRL